jgi:hypothetical protein
VHDCYAGKAIMITEFGAEANRDGPVEEKGTYAFQQDWINYQLGVMATKPWLSGALYWALNEFWVRPGWEGGNPRPLSPLFQKGLITYDGVRKPAGRRAALVHADAAVQPGARLTRRDARRMRIGWCSRWRTRRRLGSASLSSDERSRVFD